MACLIDLARRRRVRSVHADEAVINTLWWFSTSLFDFLRVDVKLVDDYTARSTNIFIFDDIRTPLPVKLKMILLWTRWDAFNLLKMSRVRQSRWEWWRCQHPTHNHMKTQNDFVVDTVRWVEDVKNEQSPTIEMRMMMLLTTTWKLKMILLWTRWDAFNLLKMSRVRQPCWWWCCWQPHENSKWFCCGHGEMSWRC